MIKEELKRGILSENPLFVLALGLCPSLAISTSLQNGLGMGLAVLCVLTLSNGLISMIRRLIPDQVRIPCYIMVVATFVTITDLLMQAYLPQLHEALGIFVPLIVVNCVVLGRAEAFASKNGVGRSLLDGLFMGLGFTLALSALSLLREVLGANKIWGQTVFPSFQPLTIFILAPGGFLAIAALMGMANFLRQRRERRA
jgi:electron transport complex protein RnfE